MNEIFRIILADPTDGNVELLEASQELLFRVKILILICSFHQINGILANIGGIIQIVVNPLKALIKLWVGQQLGEFIWK